MHHPVIASARCLVLMLGNVVFAADQLTVLAFSDESQRIVEQGKAAGLSYEGAIELAKQMQLAVAYYCCMGEDSSDVSQSQSDKVLLLHVYAGHFPSLTHICAIVA